MKRLYRFAPHSRLTNNPLFNYEVRGMRWGASGQTLLRYSLRRVAVVGGVILVLWLVNSMPYFWLQQSSDFLIIVTILSLLASLPLDYTFMSAAIGSINGDLSANRWNLLRLTPLSDRQIIAAKHGAAQVRAWRWMILVVAVRVAVTLIGVVNFALLFIRPNLSRSLLPAQTSIAVMEQLFLALLAVIYVLEPFWRMRTVTALGVAISARARQQTSSVLAAGGTVVVLWVAQGVVALAVALMSSLLLVPMALGGGGLLQVVGIFCSLSLLLGLIAAAIYGFYAVVQSWGLRRAERWIARTD